MSFPTKFLGKIPLPAVLIVPFVLQITGMVGLGSWQLLVIYILRQKAEGRWQKGGRRKHEKKRAFGIKAFS